jgi:hypothetical protein
MKGGNECCIEDCGTRTSILVQDVEYVLKYTLDKAAP